MSLTLKMLTVKKELNMDLDVRIKACVTNRNTVLCRMLIMTVAFTKLFSRFAAAAC